jgi:hypothetical protein
LIKIQLTKSDPKKTREWKVPYLMPIRVKSPKTGVKITVLSIFSLCGYSDSAQDSDLAHLFGDLNLLSEIKPPLGLFSK